MVKSAKGRKQRAAKRPAPAKASKPARSRAKAARSKGPTPKPTVIDVYTDPDVPPLPPHVTFKQARAYAESLLKGDPDRAGILRQSVKELFA